MKATSRKTAAPASCPSFSPPPTASTRPKKIASLFDMPTECIYPRFANPTCDAVEKKIAVSRGRRRRHADHLGQAASLLSILNPCSAGDSFIAVSTIYGGTINLFGVNPQEARHRVHLGGRGSG
ncbi:MAG: PLP-dependent transferase [Butyricicoccaceae bacterium]